MTNSHAQIKTHQSGSQIRTNEFSMVNGAKYPITNDWMVFCDQQGKVQLRKRGRKGLIRIGRVMGTVGKAVDFHFFPDYYR